jgi:hypothetical protein
MYFAYGSGYESGRRSRGAGDGPAEGQDLKRARSGGGGDGGRWAPAD